MSWRPSGPHCNWGMGMGLVLLKQCSNVHFHSEITYSFISISLEVMTLNLTCKHVETIEGVPLTVTGILQFI